MSTLVLVLGSLMLYVLEISFSKSATSLFYFIRVKDVKDQIQNWVHFKHNNILNVYKKEWQLVVSVFTMLFSTHPPQNKQFKHFLRASRGLVLKVLSGSGKVSRLTVTLRCCLESRSQRYSNTVRRDGRRAGQLWARIKRTEEDLTEGEQACLIRNSSHLPCSTAHARPASWHRSCIEVRPDGVAFNVSFCASGTSRRVWLDILRRGGGKLEENSDPSVAEEGGGWGWCVLV